MTKIKQTLGIQKRILIVDDEAYNLVALKNLINSLPEYKGISRLIDTADGGAESIQKAKDGLIGDGGYIYSLILMDLSMKPVDGYQATESLRQLY